MKLDQAHKHSAAGGFQHHNAARKLVLSKDRQIVDEQPIALLG